MKVIIVFLLLVLPLFSWAQCNTLRKKVNKFTGETRIVTDKSEPAVIVKELRLGKTSYYMSLVAPGDMNVNQKGVSLLLDDGTRIDWPEELVTIASSNIHPRNKLMARSYIELTSEQIQILRKRRISECKLHTFNVVVKEHSGESIRRQIECLVNMNTDEIKSE